MKRFCLSLLICVMMLCASTVFSACGKDKAYNLANLEKDFVDIVNKYEYVDLDTQNNLVFNYDKFVFNSNHYFTEANKTAPYNNLTEVYNPMVKNSMAFISTHIGVCKNAKNINGDLRNQIKSELDEFDNALSKTNSYIINVADILRLRFNQDITTEPCLIRLGNLFATYDELYESIFNLSRSMSDLYFNHMIENSNPNYSLKPIGNFDCGDVLKTLKSRINNQIVNLTEVYVEQNVKGSELYKTLTASNEGEFNKPGTALNIYMENVDLLDTNFSSDLGETLNFDAEIKQSFYEASISLYNTQASLDNIYNSYRTACNDIVYFQIKDNPNASTHEKMCKKIIDDRVALIEENNLALNKILEIIRTF